MTAKRKIICKLNDDEPTAKMLKTNHYHEDKNQSVLTKLKVFIQKNQNLKQIAWETNFIGEFHNELMRNGIKDNDFNLFSKFLETSAILYNHKIDLLHDYILRIKNHYLNTTNKTCVRKDENANMTRKQKLKKNNFIIKNPAILNKPLHMHALRDPFFSKMEVSIENNVSKMMYNMLPLSNGCYKMPEMSKPFWDSSNEYEGCLSNSEPITISDINFTNNDIRITLKNYEISNLPYETSEIIIILDSDEEMEDLNSSNPHTDSGYISNLSRNNTTQTLNTDSSFAHNDFDDILSPLKYSDDYNLSQDLEPQNFCLETESCLEMMPTTCQKFEYSYQSLEEIMDISTKPSHWKFLTSTPQKKKVRSHCNWHSKVSGREITLDYMSQSLDKISNLLLKEPSNRKQQMRKKLSNNKIDDDVVISKDIFNAFFSSPSIDIDIPICNTLTPSSSSLEYINNEVNFDCYSQDVFENFNDIANEPSIDLDPFPSTLHADNIENLKNTRMRDMKFDTLNFKKRVINVKLINVTTLSVIESECSYNHSKSINFKTVFGKSSKLLKEYNENTSVAVIFQSLLQNANEGKIKISSRFNNTKDFDIIFSK